VELPRLVLGITPPVLGITPASLGIGPLVLGITPVVLRYDPHFVSHAIVAADNTMFGLVHDGIIFPSLDHDRPDVPYLLIVAYILSQKNDRYVNQHVLIMRIQKRQYVFLHSS